MNPLFFVGLLAFGAITPALGVAEEARLPGEQAPAARAASNGCRLRYMSCTYSCGDDTACWDSCRAEYEQCEALASP